MLSVLMQVKDLLLTVTPQVFHYEAHGVTDKYIVWAEDMEGSSLEADNKKLHRSIQGTIDYFTKSGRDDTPERLEEALTNAAMSFSLNSIQYEEETGFIHYEWIFEVM